MLAASIVVVSQSVVSEHKITTFKKRIHQISVKQQCLQREKKEQ